MCRSSAGCLVFNSFLPVRCTLAALFQVESVGPAQPSSPRGSGADGGCKPSPSCPGGHVGRSAHRFALSRLITVDLNDGYYPNLKKASIRLRSRGGTI